MIEEEAGGKLCDFKMQFPYSNVSAIFNDQQIDQSCFSFKTIKLTFLF